MNSIFSAAKVEFLYHFLSTVFYRKKKDDNEPRKRRRKPKPDAAESGSVSGDEEGSELSDIDEDVKKMRVSESAAEGMETDDVLPVEEGQKGVDENQGTITTYDDGIFTVEIKGAPKKLEGDETVVDGTSEVEAFVPSARMNPLMAVKNGLLFLYGGAYEEGDRQITLSDFYSIDFNKLHEWKTIIQQDLTELVRCLFLSD